VEFPGHARVSDQFYLALRLAHLEDCAKRSNPIPFVGDDVFMTFDGTHTMNDIIALASLSQHMPRSMPITEILLSAAVEILGMGVLLV
jgi:hypothetical protein